VCILALGNYRHFILLERYSTIHLLACSNIRFFVGFGTRLSCPDFALVCFICLAAYTPEQDWMVIPIDLCAAVVVLCKGKFGLLFA
jgi:hypothetical protein